jgi:hypothetical protein
MIYRQQFLRRSSAYFFLKSATLLVVMILSMTATVALAGSPDPVLQPLPPGAKPDLFLPGAGETAEEELTTEESTIDSQQSVTPESSSIESLQNTNRIYLPLLSKQLPLSTRLGFGVGGNIADFPDVASLRAGWYLDWSVRVNPVRPNNMEYAQTVRLHQKLACERNSPDAWDRVKCPYEDDYHVRPSIAGIKAAAAANPGSLWLIGNEMDRRDFQACDQNGCYTAGQDEMLPEKYADAYYDIYHAIKEVDPGARVAIGGVIQPTPLRFEYLDRIWNSYKTKYGTEMPVDVWNIHIFALREERVETCDRSVNPICGYGADIPPGIDAQLGEYTEDDCSHLSRTDFDRRIRDMRQWMKDKGQQNKPLIISEYGPLYFGIYTGTCDDSLNPHNAQNVRDFMLWTFDYFLNTQDSNLGYPGDDYRLVQKWNWFSLNNGHIDSQGNPVSPLNGWTSLFDRAKKTITDTGILFRDYSLANMDRLIR